MSSGSKKQAVQVCIRTRPTSHFAHDNLKIDTAKNTIGVRIPRAELTDGASTAAVAAAPASPAAPNGSSTQYINNAQEEWNFRFDHVMHNAEQQAVYDLCAKDIVDGVLDGYNGTVLAYGQTGAGKSFTMIGGTTNYKYRGICPRALAHIFGSIASRAGERDSVVKMSYLEIYQEQFYDLLTDSKAADGSASASASASNGRLVDLAVRDDDVTGQVTVKGLSVHTVATEESALKLLFRGEQNRARAVHAANTSSSRSHCILSIVVETRSRVESNGSGSGASNGSAASSGVKIGKLSLVDLAGSERVGKTGSSGRVLQEAKFINKSLSFLEQVVVALAAASNASVKAARLSAAASNTLSASTAAAASAAAAASMATIPFRRSKLTNVLRDALGGNCATRLIACVVAERSSLEETVATCKFASRMMRVSNEATVNIQIDPAVQLKQYERTIRDLKQELAMHDTLANRNSAAIVYDAYTPEQQLELSASVQQYIRGDAPGDELDFVSIRHCREIFRVFRGIVRGLEATIANHAEDKRHALANAERNSDQKTESIGGGAAGAGGRGKGVSLSVGSDETKRPTSGPHAHAKGGAGGKALTEKEKAAAAAAAAEKEAAAAAARRAAQAHEFVGELDDSKGGFHIGVAPAHAKPTGTMASPKKAGAIVQPPSPQAARTAGSAVKPPAAASGFASPAKAGTATGSGKVPSPPAVASGNAQTQLPRLVDPALMHPSQLAALSAPAPVLTESAAFEVYKTSHPDGARVNAQWTANRSECKSVKAELNRVTRVLNDTKHDIDRLSRSVAAKRAQRLQEQKTAPNAATASADVEVLDEEEFAFLASLKAAKARYTEVYSGDRARLVARLSTAESTGAALKHRFVSAFLEWYHSTGGSLNASPATAAAPKPALSAQQQKEEVDAAESYLASTGGAAGGGGGARAGTAGVAFDAVTGDILDDGERFDRLEEQRLAAEDPDAVSFYKAVKSTSLDRTGKKKSSVATRKTSGNNPPRRTMKS